MSDLGEKILWCTWHDARKDLCVRAATEVLSCPSGVRILGRLKEATGSAYAIRWLKIPAMVEGTAWSDFDRALMLTACAVASYGKINTQFLTYWDAETSAAVLRGFALLLRGVPTPLFNDDEFPHSQSIRHRRNGEWSFYR